MLGQHPHVLRGRSLLLLAAALGFALVAALTVMASKPAGAASGTVGVGDASGARIFVPASVTIEVGDTVTWNWVNGFHNVVAVDGSFNSGAAHASPGAPFAQAFTAEGDFFYYCAVHATAADANPNGIKAGKMVGEVIVQARGTGKQGVVTQTTPVATATATASPTQAATPAGTPVATVTPSAPKTGQAGLVASSDGNARIALLWVALAISMVAGARVLGQRSR
jgi:plastocyanin